MNGGMVRVRVLDGWTVFDGQQQRGGGQQLDLDPEVAERWIAAGWVEPVKATRRR